MKLPRLPFVVLVAVVALVALVFLEVRGNIGRGPEDLLADARRHLESERPRSPSLVLRELDTALALARADERTDLVPQILEQRGKLLHSRAAYQAARRDFEELLTFEPPNAIEFEIRLLQIAVESRDWEGARAACEVFLAKHREHPTGLNVLGRALELGAAETFGEIDDRLAAVLVRSAYEHAIDLCERITRFPAGATEAVRLHRELELVFAAQNVLVPPGLVADLEEVVALRDQARSAFAGCLANVLDAQAAAPLVDAFMRSGAIDHAGLVADLAIRKQSSRGNLEFVQKTVEVLLASGNTAAASELAREWLADRGEQFVNMPTYLALGRALLAGEQWEPLLDMGALYLERAPRASQLRMHRDSAQAFIGYAAAALGDAETARQAFTAILFPEAEPQVRGAVEDALEWLADDARERGATADELAHLQRLCTTAPRRAGERWLRRIELELNVLGNLDDALATATDAIAAQPERAEAWFPYWRELAQTALARRGRSLDILATDLTTRNIGPRELGITRTDQFLLVEKLIEMKRYGAARYAAQLLEEQIPGFAPLIERRLEIDLALDFAADARLHAVRLVTMGARSQVALDFLRSSWSAGELPASAQLAVVRGSTSDLGTLFFLAGQLEQGAPERALLELERWRRDHPGEAAEGLAEIAARIHFALGDPERAFEELASLPATSDALRDALPLLARALASAPSDARHARFAALVAGATEVSAEATAAAARELLAGGRGDWALALLEPVRVNDLDEGAAVFELRALAALAAARLGESAEYLARSRAFADAASADLAELLFAVLRGGESDLDDALAAIDPLGQRPLERCALLVLAGEYVEAQALVPTGAVDLVDRPLWSVFAAITRTNAPVPVGLELTGSAASEFERTFGAPPSLPSAQRLFAGAVLADASAQWSAWLPVALGRLEARRGLWPGYFAWRAALRGGSRTAALERQLEVAAAFPDFDAVWEDLGALLAATPADRRSEVYLAAWPARAAALGPERLSADPSSRALARLAEASALARSGALDEALTVAREAAGGARSHPLVDLELARLERRAADHARARAAYEDAIAAIGEQSAGPLLAEYLAYLEDLLLTGALPALEHASAVSNLALSYPDDETVRAHRALASVALWRTTSLGLALEARRSSFESIRGELRSEWRGRLLTTGRPLGAEAASVLARALAQLDPTLGAEIFDAELALGPARLDLWLSYLDQLEAAERFDEVEEASAHLRTIVSAPELALWRAGFLARRAPARAAEAQELLDELPAGTEVPLATRVRLALLAGDEEEARDTAHALWEEAAGSPRAPEAALLFAHTMVRLGGAEAKREARGVVRAAFEQHLDPLQRAVLESLDHLCRLGD